MLVYIEDFDLECILSRYIEGIFVSLDGKTDPTPSLESLRLSPQTYIPFTIHKNCSIFVRLYIYVWKQACSIKYYKFLNLTIAHLNSPYSHRWVEIQKILPCAWFSCHNRYHNLHLLWLIHSLLYSIAQPLSINTNIYHTELHLLAPKPAFPSDYKLPEGTVCISIISASPVLSTLPRTWFGVGQKVCLGSSISRFRKTWICQKLYQPATDT